MLQSIFTSSLFALGLLTIASAQQKKPNIIFILADDLGVKDLGYSGSTLYKTPNIDKLASEGMEFTNAFASHPRCVPSRYGIFSGRTPARDGIPGFQDRKASKHTLPLNITTWGEVLKANGYSTGYFGKWHLGKEGGEPDKQGFSDSRIAGAAGAPNCYFFPYHIARKGKGKEGFPLVKGVKDEYLTDRLTVEAVDFIEINKNKPFALVLAHYAVHTPIEAPEQTVKKYSALLRKTNITIGNGKKDADIKTSGNGATKTIQNHPTYAAMVDHFDQSVGAVMEKLKQTGLDKNTIIVLTSDHGGLSTRSASNGREVATSNAPYRCGKGWLYDGGIRVPLLVKAPGITKPGSKSAMLTTGTDHFASLAELTQSPIATEVKIDGRSYVNALNGKQVDHIPLFFHSPLGRPTSTGDHAASAIINYPWKVYQHHGSDKIELYNIKEDIAESNNLAESNKPQLDKMKKLLSATKSELKVHHSKDTKGY